MTHISFNWPPDRPVSSVRTGFSSTAALSPNVSFGTRVEAPDIAEAVGLSIALKYFGKKSQSIGGAHLADIDAPHPWRAVTEQAISSARKLDSDSSTS